MPKLSRLHLTGIGHRDAKFDRLSLRFVDARNQPAHTLVWLPNGGGKSLLIAFKYAALRPHKRDFLGLKTGRGADLEDFVPAGKLAVVLIEFDFSEVGGERLVVGYAAVRKDQGLERTYFSFRAHPALAWETLPVAGLGPEAPNLTKLLTHFRAAAEKDKGRIAYFETISQSDWESHLRDELKLDPEIFGHHLVMNSDEGGVTKLFAKKSTDEYMQLFLELALEHESIYRITETGERVDQVRVLVADYKRAHHENPRRELTRSLCAELIPILQQIQAARLHQDEIRKQLVDAEAAGSRLLCALAAKGEELKAQIATADVAIKEKEEEERKLKDERKQCEGWADAYQQLYCRLYFEETEAQQLEAMARRDRAAYRVKLYSAATAAVRRHNAEQAHLVLVQEQRAKLQKLEPDLLELQQTGGKLKWILHDRAGRITVDEQAFKVDFAAANTRRARAEQQVKALAEAKKQVEKSLAEVVRQQNDLQQKRNQLRTKGWLNEGETAVNAATRWNAKVEELEQQQAADTRAQQEGQAHVTDKLKAAGQAQAVLNNQLAEQKRTDEKLEGFRKELATLREMPGINAVAGGNEISPWNDSLGPALDSRRHEARKLGLRLRLESQEDDRTIAHYHPPDEPIFPLPRDLEAVRAQLKQHGIHTVASAYSHLNTAHPQTAEAEEKLRLAPAEWSGLVIATQKDFDRAQQLVKTGPVTRPVVLVNGSSLNQSAKPSGHGTTVHVVLPQDRGLWNRAQAKAEIHLVQQRQQRSQEALVLAEREETEAATAHTALASLVTRHPKATVDALQQNSERLVQDVAGAKLAVEGAQREHSEAVERLGAINRRLNLRGTEIVEARPVSQQLRDHVKQFESRSEEWNEQESRCRTLIATQVDQAPGLQHELTVAVDALTAFPARHETLIERRAELRKDEQRLDDRFVGAAAAPTKQETAAALWETYESGRRQYEKASDDQVLKLRLEQAVKEQKEARESFQKVTKGFDGSPWTEWQNRDDLPVLLDKAKQEETEAGTVVTRAVQAFEMASGNWPASKRSNRGKEPIDPTRPATHSIDAEQVRDACLHAVKTAEQGREAVAETVRQLRDQRAGLRELVPQYVALTEKAPDGISASEAPHADFTGKITEDQSLASRVFVAITSQRAILTKSEATMKGLFEKDWIAVMNREVFARAEIDLRTRLLALGRSEIENDPAKHLRSLTSIKEACEDQITQLAVQRASLVQHLSARADLAAKRLKSLQTESYLPKDLDSWGGQPFLKVDLSLRGDDAERARYLGDLVEKWAKESDESDLPAGHVLAFLCLKAVLASNGATLKILKPTQRLELYWHDITELSGFSEGQRVTAAILIYSILVRLRQKQAGSVDGMALDAGYLLLDNPLGKANASALVDLQLRVAKAMGLQLIYASGINDPGTLHNFGHLLRLKNTALDPRTGDKLVQEDKRVARLSGVEIGVYPKVVVPPPPPKSPTAAAT